MSRNLNVDICMLLLVCVQTSIYTYKNIYMYKRVCVCVCRYLCLYVFLYICKYMWLYICIGSMSYISTHIIKYMSMYRHMSFDAICFDVDIQTYISIQTCLYVRSYVVRQLPTCAHIRGCCIYTCMARCA